MAWQQLQAAPRVCRRILAAALLSCLAAGIAEAKTFRWANDGDANSMDPYARQETFLLAFDQSMYEPLIRRNREMRLEPGLATEWARTEPTVWRFKLRQGVKFHDGTPFYGRRRGVFVRPRDPSRLQYREPAGDDPRGEEDRRLHRRPRHRRAGPDPALQPADLRDHVEEMVRGAQRDPRRRPDQERGELRHPQRQRHRPLHAEGAAARRAHGAGQEPELVGPRQRAGRSRRGRVQPHRERPRPASRRCCRASSTWSTRCRRRTPTGSARPPA